MNQFSKKTIQMHIIYTALFFILNIANGFLVNSTIFNEYLSTYNRDLLMIINYIFGDFGFPIVLFAFGILFFRSDQARMRYMMIITIVLSTLCIMGSMYIYNYGTVFAFSNLQALNNPAGGMALEFMLSMATVLFRHAQYLTLIPAIIMVSLYIVYTKKNREAFKGVPVVGYLRSRLYMGFSFCVIGALLMANALGSYRYDIEETWFEENGSVLYGIQTIGMYNYYVYDFYATYLTNITDLKAERRQELIDYLESKTAKDNLSPLDGESYGNNQDLAGVFEDKNLILIQVESLNNYVIGLEIDGVEVTPNLNSLAQNSTYFNNFYTTVGIGNTADAEFSAMTGLFPDGDHLSIYEYDNQSFDTLAKAFNREGYHTFSIHGNVSTFYSRGTNHIAMYGFDAHLGQEDLTSKTGLVHGWINDYDLLLATIDEMKNTPEADFAFPILVSCHTPFLEDVVIEAKLAELNYSLPQIEDDFFRGYLEHMHYVDWAVGEFLSELDEANLPEDTIVALYGDHGASVDEAVLALNQPLITNELNPFLNILGDNLDINHIYYYRKLSRQVPWLIYETSGTELPVGIDSSVHSQVDIYRTLANLFDLSMNHYFGVDCFSDEPTIAYNPRNLDFFTDQAMIIVPSELTYGEIITEDKLDELLAIMKKVKDLNDKILRWGGAS